MQRLSPIIPDAISDDLEISLGPNLGAKIASKTKPRGPPQALPDGYYFEMEKNYFLASFALVLSTRPGCNLTVKTEVFLKILTLSRFSLLHIILSHGDFKKHSKTVLEEPRKPSKRPFEANCGFEVLP